MKREVREQRLHDFVERYLAQVTSGDGDASVDRSLELIAHSPDSPIAVAVGARLAALQTCGVAVRAIFAVTKPEEALAPWLAQADWVQWARDVRLLEAHELLVMGRARCWSGDAMRRGSTKTDLFESLNEGCAETAALARQAFRKLAPLTAVIRPRRVTASLNAFPRVNAAGQPAAEEPLPPASGPIPVLRVLATRH